MLDRIHRLRRGAVTAFAVLGIAALLAGCGDKADQQQDSLSPKGPYAREIQNLFTPFFWVAVVIGVGVVGATVFAALRFRVRPGDDRQPKQVHGNSVLEITWTAIPALILAVMAVPTVATIWRLAEKPKGDDVVHITVIAKQWWWEYEYTDDDFVTANDMHIPVGRPVSLSLVGPDDGVIHSFWVPNLNGKKDVVPGRDQFLKLEADEPGEFWGQCAEYCGLSHANMRIRVFAQEEGDYNAWVKSQQQPVNADLTSFVTDTLGTKWGCTTCHAFEGVEDASARVGPNLTHLGDRTAFAGDMFEMNFPNMWKWIWDAPARKPMGPHVGSMPSFKDTKGMTEEEAKDIAKQLLCGTTQDPSRFPECTVP